MRRIKTLLLPATEAAQFDARLNKYLQEGWRLVRRDVLKIHGEMSDAYCYPTLPALYAEMEKEEPPFPEEITE